MDILPTEIISNIMLYCRDDCIRLSATYKLYRTLYLTLVKNIKQGYIPPELCLDASSYFDITKYQTCLDDFYIKTTLWTINGISGMDSMTNLSYYLTAERVFIDIHSGGYWLFLGKSHGYYVFFEGNYEPDWGWHTEHYDFTDGTFAYSQDWKQLWVDVLSKANRKNVMSQKRYIKSQLQRVIDYCRKYLSEV